MGHQPTVSATGELGLGFVLVLLMAHNPGYDSPVGRDDFVIATGEKEACWNGLANPLHQVVVFSAAE